MDLLYDRTEEELAKEISACTEKALAQVRDADKEYWEAEARFYELLIEAKGRGVHRSETLLVEADELFRKRMMLKISRDHSRAMLEASLLMLEWLLEE